MIRSEADFEAALEEVVALLDHPFTDRNGARLTALMGEIQAWKPALMSGEGLDDPTAEKRRKLQQHVARFEEDLRMHHPNVMTDLGAALKLFEDVPEPRRELGDSAP